MMIIGLQALVVLFVMVSLVTFGEPIVDAFFNTLSRWIIGYFKLLHESGKKIGRKIEGRG